MHLNTYPLAPRYSMVKGIPHALMGIAFGHLGANTYPNAL